MSDKVYTVSFAGECQEDVAESEVRAKLAKALKLDDKKIERLFSGQLVVIKKNLDETGARRFQAAFDRAGAICIVSPSLQERRNRPRAETPAPIEALKLPEAEIEASKTRKPIFMGLAAAAVIAALAVGGWFFFQETQTANVSETAQTDAEPTNQAEAAEASVTTGSSQGMVAELEATHAPRNNVEKAHNATVFIDTGFGTGSGFFVNETCTIVTNRHVIELSLEGVRELEAQRTQLKAYLSQVSSGQNRTKKLREGLAQIETAIASHDGSGNAKQIFVSLVNGREIEAMPLVISKDRDLAYLSIKEDNCPPIEANHEDDLPLGSRVFTIGNPAGMKYLVTAGIISGYQDREEKRFLQTDAAINPGNSGGPLIDNDGKLLGVNTMILRETEGIGFAIPTKELFVDYDKNRSEIDTILASTEYTSWQPAVEREDQERDKLSDEVVNETVQQCTTAYKQEDWETAVESCLIAAENGDPKSMYYLAEMTFSRTDTEARNQSIEWYDKAHQAGLPEAQYRMATFYRDGKYLDHTSDYMEIFMSACDKEYSPACNDIGVEYLRLLQYSNAPDYFLKAIRLGNIIAISNLAHLYNTGKGVQTDQKRAHELYLQAAKLGNNNSQLQIAMNHYYGKAAKKDYEQSYAWALVSEMDSPDADSSSAVMQATENVRFMLERLLNDKQKQESMVYAQEVLSQIESDLDDHLEQFEMK